jgi:hypothetical protein
VHERGDDAIDADPIERNGREDEGRETREAKRGAP